MIRRQVALLHHAANHGEKSFVQGFAGGRELLRDFFAILFVVYQALHSTQLPLYTRLARADGFFLDRVCKL